MAIPIGSRMVKRPITERTIRALATPESFARGRSYFDDSAVSDLVRRGDRLTAEVEGSELAPYRVSIRLHDDGVAEAGCSCPYDLGGYCKHIVAVLLKFADEGTRVIERKPLAKLLRELDQSQLIELLEKRAESDSELAAWIEAELATTVEPSSLRNKEVGRRRTPVDPEPVREHTRNLLAKRQHCGRYWDGYRASGDLEELQRLVEKAVPFIEVGDGSNALRILVRRTRSRAGTKSSISLIVSPMTWSAPPQQGQTRSSISIATSSRGRWSGSPCRCDAGGEPISCADAAGWRACRRAISASRSSSPRAS